MCVLYDVSDQIVSWSCECKDPSVYNCSVFQSSIFLYVGDELLHCLHLCYVVVGVWVGEGGCDGGETYFCVVEPFVDAVWDGKLGGDKDISIALRIRPKRVEAGSFCGNIFELGVQKIDDERADGCDGRTAASISINYVGIPTDTSHEQRVNVHYLY